MTNSEAEAAEMRKGLVWGLAAFLVWGGLPNLFKLVNHVPALIFGVYGYVRKVAKVEAIEGLFIETALLTPFALAYVWWLQDQGQAVVAQGDNQTLFMMLTIGVLTAVPLICFTKGARRLRLSTIGLLQYITPTLHLVGAVWLWGEELTDTHIITFACIWTALALYSAPSILATRRAKS